MAFIRTKNIRGKTFYYLVQNHREGKKVRQKVLKYLGATPPEGWQPKEKKPKDEGGSNESSTIRQG